MTFGAALTNGSRTFFAAVLSGAFVWALALSVSPQLHERVHPDAGHADHECAITLISAGKFEHSVAVPVFEPPFAHLDYSEVPTLHSVVVAPLFLTAAILEHAPPAPA